MFLATAARWPPAPLTTRAPASCPSPTAWAPGSSSPPPVAATSPPPCPGASPSCRVSDGDPGPLGRGGSEILWGNTIA
uniref:Uncharacterized protein n=1 Tax=Cairina moschata TaxID=8855 RepID=A0A8C3CL35_CAIMO